MSRKYKMITYRERLIIKDMLKNDVAAKDIAKVLGVHLATFYREIERGKNEDQEYDPELSQKRLQRGKKFTLN